MPILLSLLLTALAHAQIRMAVTIDDLTVHGALPPGATRLGVTEKILASLARARVPEAYGFVNAAKLADDPSGRRQLELWRAAGHPLGNHTFSHPSLRELEPTAYIEDIRRNEPVLAELAGSTDWKWFRYPFLHEGDTLEKRKAVRDHLSAQGYRIAQVTVDFEDWGWNDPYARCVAKGDRKAIAWLRRSYLTHARIALERAEKLARYLWGRAVPHVLLLHLGAFDAEMFDELFALYRRMGVEFVPLAQAQADSVYDEDPGLTFAWGAELTYQVLKSRGKTTRDAGLAPYAGFPKKRLEALCR